MRRAYWMFFALATVLSCDALVASEGTKAVSRRFLDYLPVGTHVVLHRYPPQSPYEIRVLSPKEFSERPEDLARFQKKREAMVREIAELKEQRQDLNAHRRLNDLENRLPHFRPPDMVYRVAAVGEDFVELRVEWSPPPMPYEGKPDESGIVLRPGSIQEIRLPAETADQQKGRL
jgi:hypothetical protein